MIKLRGVKAYANTQHARQATDVAFASYLLKQGGKGVTKWQQRWVVLKANGDIVYYKDNKSTHPKGDMRLQGPCVRAPSMPEARLCVARLFARLSSCSNFCCLGVLRNRSG